MIYNITVYICKIKQQYEDEHVIVNGILQLS